MESSPYAKISNRKELAEYDEQLARERNPNYEELEANFSKVCESIKNAFERRGLSITKVPSDYQLSCGHPYFRTRYELTLPTQPASGVRGLLSKRVPKVFLSQVAQDVIEELRKNDIESEYTESEVAVCFSRSKTGTDTLETIEVIESNFLEQAIKINRRNSWNRELLSRGYGPDLNKAVVGDLEMKMSKKLKKAKQRS